MIRPDQHARILGFGIIGFGLQFISDGFAVLGNLWRGFSNPDLDVGMTGLLGYSFGGHYYALVLLFISLIAGISLLFFKSRAQIPEIIFVLGAIGLFPLGTLLSIYLLFYLSVFNEDPVKVQNSVERTFP